MDYFQDMYDLVKSLDDTRLINIDVHHYPNLVHVESSELQYGAQGEFGSCAMGAIYNHEWVNNGCETYYNCNGPLNDADVTIKYYSDQVDFVLSMQLYIRK